MIQYFEEPNGDYLAVDTESKNRQFESLLGSPQLEGRVTGSKGDPDSIYTTDVNASYLDERCEEVEPEEVPDEWIDAIDYHEPEEVA